jgi:hypothetical protein
MLSLHIANLVVVLEAFIQAHSGKSDIVVVNDTSTVIVLEKLD